MAKSKTAINLEYFALRFFCGVVNTLPYALAAAFARSLAFLAVRVFGFKRRRTFERIQNTFPGITAPEMSRIATASFANVLVTAVEMIRAPRLDRAWMDRHVVDGPRYRDLLRGLSADGKGVVIMVPHCGNWYMAAWAMAKYGHPLFAIAARQRNPKIDAWMNRQYGDIEVLDRDCRDTLSKIKDRLHEGQAFAILPDLRVRKRDVEVDFLGGKANVSRAGAMFAVHAGSPIVVAAATRERGKHVFHHLATLRPFDGHRVNPSPVEMKVEAARLTREALSLLSAFILKHPADWYWYNKRWILEPPER